MVERDRTPPGLVDHGGLDQVDAHPRTAARLHLDVEGGEGVTGTEGNAPGQSPQAPPEKSAEAGKGGDAAQQAKVALDEARTADGKGDAKACEAALTRAEAQLKAAP